MAELTILCPNCRKPNSRNEQNLRRARFCQHCGHDIVLNNSGPSYYITRVIKEGGQGAVYEAIDQDQRIYAVKEMLDRFDDPKERAEAKARFEAEAHLLQRLSHPRIPKVYADFEDEGRHYLAMEFVRGEDLEQIIEREGAISEQQVLAWADQICDVLSYLHQNGLIYRDMKPSNIMVERQGGGIKLIDFGIAKLFQRSERGTQIGTPGYAPPEQYQGLATAESDIYALGATLHHLLSGRDPRDEAPFSFPAVVQVRPEVSRRTAEAIARALQMKPEDRFQSVDEFRAALRSMPVPQAIRRAPGLPQVAAPARPAGPPAIPVPVYPSAPAALPQRPPAGPGWLGRLVRRLFRMLLTLVLLAGLAAGALLYFAPALVEQYVPGITQLLSGVTPTPQTLVTWRQTETIQVRVPANADQQMIRQAFIDQYTATVQAKFGPDTRVDPNTFGYLSSAPEQIQVESSGETVYRAEVQAFIRAPQ